MLYLQLFSAIESLTKTLSSEKWEISVVASFQEEIFVRRIRFLNESTALTAKAEKMRFAGA